jgi:POT family proton-dependent oligopeptide transporter
LSGRTPAAALAVIVVAILAGLAVIPPVVLVRGAFVVVLGAMILAFVMLFRAAASLAERGSVRLLLVLLCGATLFWMAGEQAGTALTLFAERLTDRRIGSWQFPAAWYQALYPLYVILLAPAFVWLWKRLASSDRDPASSSKFGVGLLFAAAGLALAAVGASRAAAVLVNPMWLAGTYLLLSVGELCLGPVGLAAGTRLAPRGCTGLATGLWFLSLSLGGLMAGMTGGIFDLGTADGLRQACGSVALLLAGAGVALLAGRRFLPDSASVRPL